MVCAASVLMKLLKLIRTGEQNQIIGVQPLVGERSLERVDVGEWARDVRQRLSAGRHKSIQATALDIDNGPSKLHACTTTECLSADE